MQPGYPSSGQDPYQTNPSDPFGQPGYGQYPSPPDPYQQQPTSGQPYAEPYQNPAAFPGQPVSGQPYGDYYTPPPVTGQPYGQPEYGAGGYPPPVAQPYPATGYGVPGAPVQQNQNTFGLLSMIFGIISIPLACCYGFGALFGIAGVVLGVTGMRKASAGQASNRGMAIAGLVCGAVGIILGLVWLIVIIASPSTTSSYYNY